MSTIDLSGPRHDGDMKVIALRFHQGPKRDGKGLMEWCESLSDASDVSGQDELQTRLDELKLGMGDENLTALEAHCTNVLGVWEQVHGNDISRPASYYYRLLNCLPKTPFGTPVPTLRNWLAEKIGDQADILANPYDLIERLIKQGKALGMQEATASP